MKRNDLSAKNFCPKCEKNLGEKIREVIATTMTTCPHCQTLIYLNKEGHLSYKGLPYSRKIK